MSKVKQLMKTLGVSNEVLDLTKSVHAPKNFNTVKENLELKYFFKRSTFLMLAIKDLSTLTYSAYFALFLTSSYYF